MPAKPMLGGIELQQVQEIDGGQTEIFNQHRVPALEGDFHQDLGRRAVRIRVNGILAGPKAADNMVTLRTKFHAAAPLPFVADIATATKVNQMLIEEMGVREIAGKPNRIEYALTLVEFIGAAKAKKQASPIRPPAPKLNTGALRVAVTAGGQPRLDNNHAVVMVEQADQNGARVLKTLALRPGDIWADESLRPGQYTVRAALTEPPMSGSAAVTVRNAQTARVTVTLLPGATIAHAFGVHFSPGKSFVEPAMFPVLRQAAAYALAHPSEKILIAGHADAGGDLADHQRISEQRAQAVFACLTHGNAREAALVGWHSLRQSAAAEPRGVWGRREYQLILQDLGYFQGQIDGEPHLTDTVVRDFQLDHWLKVDGIVADATWAALIDAYLVQNGLAIETRRFAPDGVLGLGISRLAANTREAWRPNRRVEVLFLKSGAQLVNPAAWVILPAEPGEIGVAGSIRLDDGTPCGGLRYVLTAPDGEYMDGEQPGGSRGDSPISGRTDATGRFAYHEKPKGIGIYTLEVLGPFVARLADEPRSAAKGTHVTARLDGSRNFDIVVSRR
jgi:outer membrane protein OmpA-like peptidoglycan-associated protein